MITLYKRDTKGKTRILNISAQGSELVQESGLINGALVEHRKECKPKNIGKSNATTAEQQAVSEMNSKITEKLTEGYFKTQFEAENEEVILPMLAKDYKTEKEKVDWSNAYIQPKLDGMRCLAHICNGNVILKSRDGKVIDTVPHINEYLKTITENVILDGELYKHGETFQENMRLIKKYRKGETETISFHVYDIINDLPFYKRKVRHLIEKNSPLIEVSTYQIFNEEELKKHHVNFINLGYEGSIIRNGNGLYKVNGRSSNLLKYKDFIDIVLPIKNIEPADARPDWGIPVFHWSGAVNDELRAGVKMSHEERKNMLLYKEDYIGKSAELRFFEYSELGVPRFPVMVGIRLDK